MTHELQPDAINFAKLNGLVPAVVQHASTHAVLMVGFMTREALDRTLNTRLVTFWSRSRQQLWQKGESSGNALDMVSIHLDCDKDALLVMALPRGPVCHTGEETCFGISDVGKGSVLTRLQDTISERKRTMPPDSYTTELFASGTSRISQKVGEEGLEVALASVQNKREAVKEESADLLYHLLVLLQQHGLKLEDVEEVLRKRMK